MTLGTHHDQPLTLDDLSGRELDVLMGLTMDLSLDEIAERHHQPVGEVRAHLRSAYATIGVTTREDAVAWAHAHSISPHDDDGR